MQANIRPRRKMAPAHESGQQFFSDDLEIGLLSAGLEEGQVFLGLEGVLAGQGPGVAQRAVFIERLELRPSPG
jgi:hypothetical protein